MPTIDELVARIEKLEAHDAQVDGVFVWFSNKILPWLTGKAASLVYGIAIGSGATYVAVPTPAPVVEKVNVPGPEKVIIREVEKEAIAAPKGTSKPKE